MSGIHRTKIEWCDATWNPISGCLHGCAYCYAAKLTKRFQPKPDEWPEQGNVTTARHDGRCYIELKPTILRDADGKYLRSTPYPKGFAPTFHAHKLENLSAAKMPRRIFVGSMADMLGDWVPDEWIAKIFQACKSAPQHTYLFLTKNPRRYTELAKSGLLPEDGNYWFGSSCPAQDTEFWRSDRHNTFVSVEPIHGNFDRIEKEQQFKKTGWLIIGAETGNRKGKIIPEREWVQNIVDNCRDTRTPVFMKNNLAPIWGKDLIQEYPRQHK
jgi:protein gp37